MYLSCLFVTHPILFLTRAASFAKLWRVGLSFCGSLLQKGKVRGTRAGMRAGQWMLGGGGRGNGDRAQGERGNKVWMNSHSRLLHLDGRATRDHQKRKFHCAFVRWARRSHKHLNSLLTSRDTRNTPPGQRKYPEKLFGLIWPWRALVAPLAARVCELRGCIHLSALDARSDQPLCHGEGSHDRRCDYARVLRGSPWECMRSCNFEGCFQKTFWLKESVWRNCYNAQLATFAAGHSAVLKDAFKLGEREWRTGVLETDEDYCSNDFPNQK